METSAFIRLKKVLTFHITKISHRTIASLAAIPDTLNKCSHLFNISAKGTRDSIVQTFYLYS